MSVPSDTLMYPPIPSSSLLLLRQIAIANLTGYGVGTSRIALNPDDVIGCFSPVLGNTLAQRYCITKGEYMTSCILKVDQIHSYT
jgi:hypothetical protein